MLRSLDWIFRLDLVDAGCRLLVANWVSLVSSRLLASADLTLPQIKQIPGFLDAMYAMTISMQFRTTWMQIVQKVLEIGNPEWYNDFSAPAWVNGCSSVDLFSDQLVDTCLYRICKLIKFMKNRSPGGPLDPKFVLRALRALRPCDPRHSDWIVC